MSKIDVSKCGFYHKEYGKECHIALAFAENYTDAEHTYFLCEQNPNCYYKQLQQLKAENEELKEIVDELLPIKIPVISQGINETDEDYKQRILNTMKDNEVKGSE